MRESTLYRRLNRLGRVVARLLPVLLLCLGMARTAGAGLQAVGPTDPVTTIPTWYQDTGNLALMPCLDQNGFCLLPPPFDPAFPPVTTITTTGPITDANFPAEGFYYSADALLPIEGGELARLTFVLEYAYLSGVVPNTGNVFLRTDLQKMRNLAASATYRVTHPYGQFTFTTDATGRTTGAGGVAVRQEDQTGTAAAWLPPLMQAAAITNIGPFLKPASGILPTALVNGETHTYIGDAATPVAVTGSPTGNNFYRIERLRADGSAAATWETNLFTLAGRVYTDQIPAPLLVDRVTYARDAAGGQVDVFATASTAASLSISGTGLAATPLSRDVTNAGKFFAHLPFATLPTGLTVTNSLDVPPVLHPVTPGDEILISQAFYNPLARTLTVKAASRDKLDPPTLTVPAFAAPNALDASGTVVLPLPLNTIPPLTVQVVSSHGGTATEPVSIVVPTIPPVAVDDSASTGYATAVTIGVLLNDTTASALDPATVRVVTPSPDGTATVTAGGAIVFTPAAGFGGAASFTYDVRDIYGQQSNTATVTVTVAPPPVPVAVADSATTSVGTPVTIAVLSNDTGSLNPASVSITTPSANGTAVANGNGTITFTPAAGFSGTTSFAYTVNNAATPPVTSNAATVTVTVTPAPAPVARADSATTPAGTAVTIPVLANDTIVVPGVIDTASVEISSPSLNGTAVANLNGTVTFTPAAGFTGSTSFAYSVANNAQPPLRSNVATVTVTVTAVAPAPVAVADSATTTAGTPVTINVLANDTIAPPGVIAPASVAITTQSLNGTAVANLNGTVTFTPAAGFTGTTTFAYTVANNSLPPLSSNAALVTVTVNAAAAQTIQVSRAQFTLNGATWRVDGTVTPAPAAGTTVTIYNNATVGVAPLVANVAVSGNGSFTWSSPNNAPLPNAARRISIQSNQVPTTKVENVSVTVR